MNNSSKQSQSSIGAILACVLMLAASCTRGDGHRDASLGPDEYYTCSMDPQVVTYAPGNCPICHMKLVRARKNSLKPGQITLSAQQINLANIICDTVHQGLMGRDIILTGRVTYDQRNSDVVSSRVRGRIQHLAVKSPGDFVSKGQLLYEISSEDLNEAQQEYLIAVQKEPVPGPDHPVTTRFAGAARNRLLLYGMTDAQIDRLKSSGKPLPSVPFYATMGGIVNSVSVAEGDEVGAGTTLFQFRGLNTLWVEAQTYLPYLPYLRIGTGASFSIPALGDRTVNGRTIFIDPQVSAPDRFVLARFQLENPSRDIRPGMLANITLRTQQTVGLSLPVDAVIQDGKGASVWVRNPDGVFEIRMVSVRDRNAGRVEITGGLNEAEVVVVSGTYLLNSEYILKKGVSPMQGHNQGMPGMKM